MLEFSLSLLAAVRVFFRSRHDTAFEVLALRQRVDDRALDPAASSVAFGYMVRSFGSYDRAILPLAFMLVVRGSVFALIRPAR